MLPPRAIRSTTCHDTPAHRFDAPEIVLYAVGDKYAAIERLARLGKTVPLCFVCVGNSEQGSVTSPPSTRSSRPRTCKPSTQQEPSIERLTQLANNHLRGQESQVRETRIQ
ncbi:hypothetical protein GCM10009573_07920 [Agromyces bracchium]